MPKLMLSGSWSPGNETGLVELKSEDINTNFTFANKSVNEIGVPNILSGDFLFGILLELGRDDKFLQNGTEPSEYSIKYLHILLLKGIFYGILAPREITFKSLGMLGELLKAEYARFGGTGGAVDKIYVFTHAERDYAVSSPVCLVSPATSLTDAQISALEREVKTAEHESSISADLFHHWLQNTLPWTDYSKKNRVENVKVERHLNKTFVLLTIPLLDKVKKQITPKTIKSHYANPVVCPNEACHENLSAVPGEIVLKHDKRTPLCPKCNKGLEKYTDLGNQGLYFDGREYIIWKNSNQGYPVGAQSVEYIQGQNEKELLGAVFSFGAMRIKVLGTVIDLSDTFCKSVVKIKRTGGTIVEGKLPDWPVKTQYLRHVNMEQEAVLEIFNSTVVEYEIYFKGLRDSVKYKPIVKPEMFVPNLLLWPNFELDGWTRNMACHLGEKTKSTYLDECLVRLIDRKGLDAGETGIELKEREQITSHTPFSGFEVAIRESREPLGYFRLSRPKITRNSNRHLNIGVDFGTSNTCMAYKFAGESSGSVLALKDCTYWYDRKNGAEESNCMDLAVELGLWLPTFGRDELKTLPSELAFFAKPLEEYRHKISTNAKYDTYPPSKRLSLFNIPRPDFRQISGFTNFRYLKWEVSRDDNARAMTRSYLEYILELALASISQLGTNEIPEHVTLRASYPLDFSLDHKTKYTAVLNLSAETVTEGTGANVTVQEFVSESEAGKIACGITDGLGLVLDLGGGTLDVALFNKKDEPIFIDSIRYGGRDYISIMAAKDLFPDDLYNRFFEADASKLGRKTVNERKGEAIESLKKTFTKIPDHGKLLSEIILEWFFRKQDVFVKDTLSAASYDGKRRLLTKMTNNFFDAILLYTAKLVDAYKDKGNKFGDETRLSIFLLGNGWGMLQGYGNYEEQNFKKNSYFKKLVVGTTNWPDPERNIEVHLPANCTGKEAVSMGLVNKTDFPQRAAVETKKSFIGLDGYIKIPTGNQNFSSTDLVPLILHGTRDPNTVNVIVEKYDFNTGGGWGDKVKFFTANYSQYNVIYNNAIRLELDEVRLTKSLLEVFMEEVYLEWMKSQKW